MLRFAAFLKQFEFKDKKICEALWWFKHGVSVFENRLPSKSTANEFSKYYIVYFVEKIHFPSTTNQKCREVPFPFFAVRCTRPNEWTETMASFLLLSEIS